MPSAFDLMVDAELTRARIKFPQGIHSGHEGYGVLMEEMAEFFDEVRQQASDSRRMLAELVQIAAMARRTAEDLGLCVFLNGEGYPLSSGHPLRCG